MSPNALIVGGTGMLAGLSAALADDGYRVFLPSRRPTGADGFEADWTDPAAFVQAVREQITGPLDLLVLWCHRPYRAEVARLLTADVSRTTAVVEVVGSRQYRAKPGNERHFPQSVLVVLGHVEKVGGRRWLTDAEISDGVLTGCGLEPGSRHIVGAVDD